MEPDKTSGASGATAPHGIGDEDLRLLADSAQDFAMIFTDPERNVVRWSAGAEHVLGWTEEEALGRSDRDLIFTPEDKAAGVPQQEQDTALREGCAEDERWHIKKDGTRFFASGVMTPLYDPSTGALRGFGKVLRDITRRKRLEEELQQANRTLEARVRERTAALENTLAERQALLERVVTVQEEERRRISRELHDQTGQHLTALSLGLKALDETYRSDGQARPLLERLRAVADQMACDLHRIAVELRPAALDDVGVVPALAHYVEGWSQRTGVPAEFHNHGLDEGGGERLPALVETSVYRVVQEALTNVARHATTGPGAATRVSVTLQRFGGHLQAVVEDDGPGFDPRDAAHSGRLGLAGMQERAASCGGTLEVESAPGQGATVFLRVPFALVDQPESCRDVRSAS